jgi:hypothetical protein
MPRQARGIGRLDRNGLGERLMRVAPWSDNSLVENGSMAYKLTIRSRAGGGPESAISGRHREDSDFDNSYGRSKLADTDQPSPPLHK